MRMCIVSLNILWYRNHLLRISSLSETSSYCVWWRRTLPNLLGCLLSRRFPVHTSESWPVFFRSMLHLFGAILNDVTSRNDLRNVNKLSALCTDPVSFSFRSLLELAEVIFSSKSLEKSSIKVFPFNFQLSDDFCEDFGRKSRIGFSVAMSCFLCLLKYLSEVSITKSNLVWFSWPLFDFSHHEAGLSRKRFYGSDVW